MPNHTCAAPFTYRDVTGTRHRVVVHKRADDAWQVLDIAVIETLTGLSLRGTWDELVQHLQTVEGAWADGTLKQFMQVFARRGTAETGVRIPIGNSEAFLRGAAAAGVIRILQ